MRRALSFIDLSLFYPHTKRRPIQFKFLRYAADRAAVFADESHSFHLDSCVKVLRFLLSDMRTLILLGFSMSTKPGQVQFGKPEIFNTDQGAQFTARDFIAPLQDSGIKVSMDGKGRCIDNVFVERLWRSLKYEEVYLNPYESMPEARTGIGRYLKFFNNDRPHKALGYQTPLSFYNSIGSSAA